MQDRLRKGVSRLVATAVMASVIVGSVPVEAVASGETPLDRRQAVARAKTWTRTRVPYSQKGHRNGYRRDCSGFISMAWDLPENLTTWRIPRVARRIKKNQLRPGDILLNHKTGPGRRHVVMFEKWANKKRTKYYALESTGQNGVDGAIRRVVPYPYRVDKRNYKPYRYVGMGGYWRKVKVRDHQPVRGYNGRVDVPKRILNKRAALKRAQIRKAKRHAMAKRRAALRLEKQRMARRRAVIAKSRRMPTSVAQQPVDSQQGSPKPKAPEAAKAKRPRPKQNFLKALLETLGLIR